LQQLLQGNSDTAITATPSNTNTTAAFLLRLHPSAAV